MTAADAEYLKAMREKMAAYPRLAREELRRRERDKAEEYWRLWHERGRRAPLRRAGALTP